MNVLAKAKSDSRVIEVKEIIDSGDALDRAEAKVASGALKPVWPHDDKVR